MTRGPSPSVVTLALLLGLPVAARPEGRPQVQTSLSPRAVTVGEPVALTVDVFVPTYFTGAPRFPPLEVKDAVVVFLDVGGQNRVEQIEGQEYAVQRRAYLIYPQRAGEYDVAAFEVSVRYALDGKPTPRTPVPARGGRFKATVPDAAKGLDYFIATPSFDLSEAVDPALEGLKAGDSVTRTISMTATEAFAMMLPPLTFPAADGLSVYPAQPRVSDSAGERGATRVAKRVESVTYVLQKEGQYRLPPIEIEWWDTGARTLRRSRLPELVLNVAPNPGLKAEIPLPEDPSLKPPPPDPWKPLREALRRYGPLSLLGVVTLALLYRIFQGRIRALRERRLERLKQREEFDAVHLDRLRQAAGSGPAQLLAATYRYLDRRGDGVGPAARLDRFAQQSGDALLPRLADALVESALAGSEGAAGSGPAFVEAVAHAARKQGNAGPVPGGLGPLNPR